MKTARWLQKRGWTLAVLCVLALYPVVFGTGGGTTVLVEVFAFGALAMSYDLLLGYTGIVSFGHAMFFGTGAYCGAIWLEKTGGDALGLALGAISAVVLSLALSVIVAFLSLRVKNVYFAMITLAVGEVFLVLAGSQGLRPLTNADDGIVVPTPGWLSGDLSVYYLGLVFLVVTGFVLSRLISSPAGYALAGIRENEHRALSLGHSVVRLKTVAFLVSGVFAALSGVLFAIAESFVSTSVYDVAGVSLNVLLMVVIGGTGTLYGGVVGAGLIVLLQSWLASFGGTSSFFQNDYILFGVIYILVVRFMPKGIVGGLRDWGGRKRWKHLSPYKESRI